MQLAAVVLCLFGAFQAARGTLAVSSIDARQPAASMSPVTRIVELLKVLQEQCEADSKTEETLYEKFVCWGKQVIKQKEGTNALAEQESSELKQYIEDLSSGRIELTSERVDLEKEISDLMSTRETNTAQRMKDKQDFLTARDEMTQAIDALTEAADVLKTATEGHETGVLAEVKVQAGHRAEYEAKQAALLQHAAELGDRFLTKGDALFLRRLLTGEVPTADWKKLNRKATFKMSYKARSFKIQDVIAKLLETFTTNREEAKAKEKAAVTAFKDERAVLLKQLQMARVALKKMDVEKGAKMLSKTEAQDRVDLLTDQIANDEKYIAQVKDEIKVKTDEWNERSRIRMGEIEAISKAIEILHNDDARDLFKKSLASQGYFFLQTGQRSREHDAADVLRNVARTTSDKRVQALVKQMELAPPAFGSLANYFEPIITKIDELVQLIQDEESSDMAKKETCEQSRADNTRSAIKLSREIDEQTDTMTSLTSKIEKLSQQIAENQDVMKILDQQMKDATTQRTAENDAYLKDKKDDDEAAKTVQDAADVLKGFYQSENLMLVQNKGRGRAPVVVQAGEAPPPPPATWEDPYGGRTGESTGVLAILGMIKEDILRDISKADSAEAKSEASYQKLMGALSGEFKDRTQDDNDMMQAKAGLEGDHTDTKSERAVKKTGLEQVMASISDLEPDCNYFTVNFPVRVKNRQTETDGLLKAKAILMGADTDPTKEAEAKKWANVPKILRPKEFQLPQLSVHSAPAGRHQ